MMKLLKKFKLAIAFGLTAGSFFLVGFSLFGYLILDNKQKCIDEFNAMDDNKVREMIERYYGHNIVHTGLTYNHVEGFVYMYTTKCELRK